MKQFVLTTKSQSGDDYIYFIKSEEEPTWDQIDKFLLEQGSDHGENEDGEEESYEDVIEFIEIPTIEKFDLI